VTSISCAAAFDAAVAACGNGRLIASLTDQNRIADRARLGKRLTDRPTHSSIFATQAIVVGKGAGQEPAQRDAGQAGRRDWVVAGRIIRGSKCLIVLVMDFQVGDSEQEGERAESTAGLLRDPS